ncbi:hypothetical protein Hanom_Chr12g01100341 [Helianthus anomalus]
MQGFVNSCKVLFKLVILVYRVRNRSKGVQVESVIFSIGIVGPVRSGQVMLVDPQNTCPFYLSLFITNALIMITKRILCQSSYHGKCSTHKTKTRKHEWRVVRQE